MNRLFRALADATRRDILRRCQRDEPSVSQLAGVYPMSFVTVQKHVIGQPTKHMDIDPRCLDRR